jgi:hypothetical protein
MYGTYLATLLGLALATENGIFQQYLPQIGRLPARWYIQ